MPKEIWPLGLYANLTEIAMLMPILTVKTSVVAAQAAAVVETVMPKERTLPVPVRISGNQSEAVLKILETLNRHLVGSEPLPKEALIRLLDTLAKILKFPPLPQETLRDFSKRLAVFLETLPPAARLALEKQLGQRNLAVSIRILAEALKTPSIIDAPRLLDRLFTPPTAARPIVGQPDGKPVSALPSPQNQATVPGRQTVLAATQPLVAGPAILPDPGLLQAALKKAFGDDDDIAPPVLSTEESETEQGAVAALRRDDQPAKAPTARGNDSAAASAQPQQPAKANAETIPLLRAAAAFLAADPEALSLVVAIATGDIDSRVKIELELELSEQTEPMASSDQPVQSEPQTPAEHSAIENKPAPEIEASHDKETAAFGNQPASRQGLGLLEDLPLLEINTESMGFFSVEPDVVANMTASTIRPPLPRTNNEVDGFKGHDLGEWELELEPDSQSFAVAEEAPPATFEPEMERSEKVLAQTLKALVEASLPLPEGAVDGADTLFAALAGETADMGAEILFAQLEATEDAGILPDTALLTGDIGDGAEPLGLEADSWSAMLDGSEEKAADRPPFTHPSSLDENPREAQTPRLADAGIARDAIPFAMIPYLPAKTQDGRTTKLEDEEQPAFAGDEDEGQRDEGDGQPEDRDDSAAAAPQMEAEEDESDADTAYDLYRRMGGLG